MPDLTPKPHGHGESGFESHKGIIIKDFQSTGGHYYYGEETEKLNIPQTILFGWMHKLGIQNGKSHIKPSLSMSQSLNIYFTYYIN
jgi:hypothetical protein